MCVLVMLHAVKPASLTLRGDATSRGIRTLRTPYMEPMRTESMVGVSAYVNFR